MNDQRRILVIVFAVVAGAMGAYYGYTKVWVEPIAQAERNLARAREKQDDSQEKLTEARIAAAELQDVAKLCLPGDPQLAQSRYQAYLIELLTAADIKTPTVSPGTQKKQGDIYVIPFAIEADADIWSVAKLLYSFYSTPRLQEITKLSLTPLERKDIGPTLRISMNIEAIALGEHQGPARLEELTFTPPVDSDREAYGVLVERNVLFASGPRSMTVRANDPEHVALIATSIDPAGGSPEAVLYDRAQNTNWNVRIGEECTVGRTRGVIVDIDFRDVVLKVDGNLYVWQLGETFNSRTILSAEEALDREVRKSRRMRDVNEPAVKVSGSG